MKRTVEKLYDHALSTIIRLIITNLYLFVIILYSAIENVMKTITLLKTI